MTTVTEFSVTSHVCAVERSTFVKRAGYFLCLVLERDDFGGFGLLVPFGTPDAPGNVAACCAANAEFRRGFRVDVPVRFDKIELGMVFAEFIVVISVSWSWVMTKKIAATDACCCWFECTKIRRNKFLCFLSLAENGRLFHYWFFQSVFCAISIITNFQRIRCQLAAIQPTIFFLFVMLSHQWFKSIETILRLITTAASSHFRGFLRRIHIELHFIERFNHNNNNDSKEK